VGLIGVSCRIVLAPRFEGLERKGTSVAMPSLAAPRKRIENSRTAVAAGLSGNCCLCGHVVFCQTSSA
jgi:hypothetical protein